MADYALPIAALGVLMLLGAWREYTADNPRDARLLAGFGVGGVFAGAAVWLV